MLGMKSRTTKVGTADYVADVRLAWRTTTSATLRMDHRPCHGICSPDTGRRALWGFAGEAVVRALRAPEKLANDLLLSQEDDPTLDDLGGTGAIRQSES